MNRAQALKEARRLFGERAAVRDLGRPTSEEARKAASVQLPEARALYQSATAKERKAYRAELDALLSVALTYRYTVGYIGGGGLYFSIQGQGDTWDEAFAKVDRIYKVQAAA